MNAVSQKPQKFSLPQFFKQLQQDKINTKTYKLMMMHTQFQLRVDLIFSHINI
jgi:hypothetical protein